MRSRQVSIVRSLIWRLGRKMYMYARGDRVNNPLVNGEYWLLEQVLNVLSPSRILLDVGANKGNWTAKSLELSQTSNEIHIHAFEPSLATRSMIIARFVECDAVTVHPYALSETVGETTFYSDEDGCGTNSLSPTSGKNKETVKVTTLDHFLQQLGIENILIVKIDTEGFDLLVMKGAELSLQNGRIEVIQFEYNWRWLLNHTSLRDVFVYISDKPYRFGKLVGESIEFYDEWHPELDRYFENNYVLIRRDSVLCSLGTDMFYNYSNTVATDSTRRSMSQSNQMSLVRKSLTSALAAIFLSVGRFLLMAILARRLSSTALGQFAYAQWLVDIAFMVSAFGFNGSASRYIAEYSTDPIRKAIFIRQWWPWALLLPVLSGIGVVVGARFSGLALTPHEYAMLAVWALTTGWWAMQTGSLIGHQRFDLVLKSNLLSIVIIIPTVLIIPINNNSHTLLFFAMALSSLLANVMGIQQNIKSMVNLTAPRTVEMSWSKIQRYTVNVWITGLLGGLVWSRGELPLVQGNLGDIGVAQYSVALTLFFGAMQGIMIWVSGIAPHLTSEWGCGHKTQAIAIARKFSDIQLLASSCIALLLTCFGPELLELIFGPTFRMSAQPLTILVLGLITLSASAQNHLLQIDTDAKFTRNISFMGLIILYMIAPITIPWFGIEGAAISRTFTMWGMFLVTIFITLRSWGNAALSVRNILLSFCLVLVSTHISINNLNNHGIRIIVGLVCVTALAVLIRGENGRLVAIDSVNDGVSRIWQWVVLGRQAS